MFSCREYTLQGWLLRVERGFRSAHMPRHTEETTSLKINPTRLRMPRGSYAHQSSVPARRPPQTDAKRRGSV